MGCLQMSVCHGTCDFVLAPTLRQIIPPQILAAISMFTFVSTVTTVSNNPVSNDGSILVVIINFSTPLSPSCEEGVLTLYPSPKSLP